MNLDRLLYLNKLMISTLRTEPVIEPRQIVVFKLVKILTENNYNRIEPRQIVVFKLMWPFVPTMSSPIEPRQIVVFKFEEKNDVSSDSLSIEPRQIVVFKSPPHTAHK